MPTTKCSRTFQKRCTPVSGHITGFGAHLNSSLTAAAIASIIEIWFAFSPHLNEIDEFMACLLKLSFSPIQNIHSLCR
jgi:hypothetical protein